MISAVRRHWRLIKARLLHLLTKPDRESVEALLVLALGWHANRLALAAGWPALPPLSAGALDGHGRAMIDTGNDFWRALINQGGWYDVGTAAAALCGLTALALLSLLEEWTRARLACSLAGSAWWLWTGLMLSWHTPGHIGGGLYLILGCASGWVWLGLNHQREVERHNARRAGMTRVSHLELDRAADAVRAANGADLRAAGGEHVTARLKSGTRDGRRGA